MAVTAFQRDICRLIAGRLRASGELYVAVGVALNIAVDGVRVSRDLDLFHDTTEALNASWHQDIDVLAQQGIAVTVLRDAEGFKEVVARRGDHELLLQWTRDSAFRFFPLVEHEDLGLTLHPFDLATNKVLALVGRLEPRDWIDVLQCDGRIQPLGYLAWAACGKDPGFSPTSLLAEARRSGRYSQDELQALDFAGVPPDAAQLGATWHAILKEADMVVAALSGQPVGTCVLDASSHLCILPGNEIGSALSRAELQFHKGTIRGSVPSMRGLTDSVRHGIVN